MVDLPTGTVTFLFTDIEGSTRLLERLRARYDEVLADHERILRGCFESHGGRVVDTQGDSFFAVYARADEAVASALDAQRALARHDWPDGVEVRVRMGLHSGEPRPTGERYVGFGVHKAARIGAVGHGGQILLSNATRELVEDELAPDTHLRDLGVYRLKDVTRPERLFQVEAEGLRREFPALRAPRGATSRSVRRLSLLGAAIVAVGAAAVVGLYLRADESAAAGSAANPISIVTPWEGRERAAFVRVIDAFEQRTGLQVRIEVRPQDVEFASHVRTRIEAADPPMVAILPSPGVLAEYARKETIQPLASLGVSDRALIRSYGKPWVDLVTVDGNVYGIPVKAGSKSLVWYRPDDFEAMGLRVPKTWRELLTVTRRIKAMGETPWALSGAEAWTLTDWFENVYIRTAGPEQYGRLFSGQLPFDDGSVVEALRRMTTILDDRYVVGGIAGALGTGFGDAIGFVFFADPRAHLFMEGGFVGSEALYYVKPTPKPGKTIGSAPFPTIDPRHGSPVVVGGDFVAALDDNDAVRELLGFLHSPEAASLWVLTGPVVSPHRGVRPSAYPSVLARSEAAQLARATDVRFDGSDLLPGSLAEAWGTTLQRVLRRPGETPRLVAEFQLQAAPVFRQ